MNTKNLTPQGLPNIELTTNALESVNLQDFAGKVLLIVNVASQCGFTPQYKALQALYDALHNQGLEILAFPCNQFGGQEPGSAQEIKSFCELNYGVTFPLFQKTDVNGAQAHPLFNYLKSAAPGILGTQAIKWNFTKFLINKAADSITRFAPTDDISKIRQSILQML